MSTSEWPELTSETREFWDQNAAFWDEYIGEGNHFHNQLIRPTVERLLAIKPGEVVLDVACGNGNFSRRLATLGAKVEEPVFESKSNEKRSLSWINYSEIPPILVARTRRMN